MLDQVQAAVFIPIIIIAITQMIKMKFPTITGWLTIFIAFVVGIIVALIAPYIGVADVSIAHGLMYALEAVGITTALSKGRESGATGDQ